MRCLLNKKNIDTHKCIRFRLQKKNIKLLNRNLGLYNNVITNARMTITSNSKDRHWCVLD